MEIIRPIADRKRLINEFLELTAIDAESLKEGRLANRLKEKFAALGCSVEEDDAGDRINGSCGNLFITCDGNSKEPTPILLSAHMDTVAPGTGKEGTLTKEGRIVGNGRSVLGADDVTGIVEILEGLRILEERDIPHRPVEILLTVSEETFGRGVNAFDVSKIRSKDAYVLDLTGPVGRAAVQAPTLIMFRIKVLGRAAHAGFEPERGINAIQVCSRAIASLKQGQIDEDTTFNIGKVEGGRVTNIVSDFCKATGEVRSYDHQKAERIVAETVEAFRREAEAVGARIEAKSNVLIRAYRIDEDEQVCRRFLKARERAGIGLSGRETAEGKEDGTSCFLSTFGGSDNNVLTARGLRGIVLSSGMYEPHSLEEYTTVEDLAKGAELVAALCTTEDGDYSNPG